MTDQSYDQVNQQPANDEEGGIEVNEKQFKASQQKPEQARPILMPFADQDQDTPFQAASAAKAPLSPFKKAVVAITFVGGCAGLFAGLASLKADRSGVEGKSPSTSRDIDGTSSVSEPSMSTFAQLPHFDASILEGYPGTDGCDDLEVDLLEALGLMTNITIDSLAKSHFQNPWFPTCRGGLGTDCWVAFEPTEDYYIVEDREFISDGIPVADAPVEITDEMGSIPNERGEDSFGTNNQVQGVDEADIVKSDGTNVYSAYGDKLVVWNVDGELLSETTIPTDDDNGVDICEKKFKIWNSTSECYSQDSHGGWYHYRQRERKASIAFPSPSEPIKIASLLLHEGKLTVIATTSYKLNTSTSKLENERNTRLFMYDVSDANLPTDGSALTLIARKDLHGKYQTARSIGSYSHVVSSSSLATRSHLDEYLYPWSKEYAGMNETEYRSAALEVARNKTAIFASDLTEELAQLFGNDCSKLAKIAVMLREQTSDTDTDGDAMLPSFTDSSILKSLTQVHSFDMNQQSFVQTKMANSYPKIGTTSSGIFFPTASYTTNVYASSEKLVVSGEAYTQDADGEWNERTVLLVYGLEEDSSIPQAVGEVPGSLLNQFSMDHNKVDDVDYLRVATTSWAKWGLVNGTWGQTESSESQITVLKIPNDSEDTSVMEEVGSVDGIGVDERIYAARFFGDKAYVVTFRMIDPFYTVDMSIPDDPKVVGELKIPGFSNYLHPVNDTLILAIGQNATVQGRTDGLMISLFDVSDFAFPKKIREFVEDHSASSSDAQYDHRAFRYLPDSKLLILPLEINQRWNTPKAFFDGFVVYDVDESNPFYKKFNISHVGVDEAADFCWSKKKLSSRSMVFDGDVMTMKGHKVLSHSVDEGTFKWDLNLDLNEDTNKEFCYYW